MDNVSAFALFRAIVEAGGISSAALVLDSSPAAVSRGLSALEKKLGVQLAERQSRRFKLTDEGLLLYVRCCGILDQIRDIEAEVGSRGSAARGLLRIGAPEDLGRRVIAPLIARFTSLHPGLSVHLIPSDLGLEVGLDNCDVVLRFGLPIDEGMVARKLSVIPKILCAAPSYLARYPAPSCPKDLVSHNCLCLQRRHQLLDEWSFIKNDHKEAVKVSGTLASTNGEVLRRWALSGEGISYEASWDIEEDLAAGRLIELLAEYQHSNLELYVVYAPGSPVPPRVRIFVDYIITVFKTMGAFGQNIQNDGA